VKTKANKKRKSNDKRAKKRIQIRKIKINKKFFQQQTHKEAFISSNHFLLFFFLAAFACNVKVDLGKRNNNNK
jgi:hypothetical protein